MATQSRNKTATANSTRRKRTRVDPVSVELVRNSLVAATEEMKSVLMRTSYNMIIYEALDDVRAAMRKLLAPNYIEKELGKGAMGVVYLGRDPKINRVVAIKTMALSQEFEADELVNWKRENDRWIRE